MNCVHPATTHSTVVGVIHEVDRRRFLSTTPVHRRTDTAPGNGHSPWTFSLGHFPTLACDGMRQESAGAALDSGEPITAQICT